MKTVRLVVVVCLLVPTLLLPAMEPRKLDRHFSLTPNTQGGYLVEELHPAVTYSDVVPVPRSAVLLAPVDPAKRVNHLVRGKMAAAHPGEPIEVLITFRETVDIPSLPKSYGHESDDSPRNRENRLKREALVRQVEVKREAVNAGRRGRFARLGVDLRETFWIADVWRAFVPAGSIDAVAADPDVQAVELAASGTPPPGTALQGRQTMRSDWFADSNNIFFEFWRIRIAILDTGVRKTHVMFNNPSYIGIWRDCVNGTSGNCTVGSNLNPDDTYWDHGTKTAGIISGNSALGNTYRGVSRCTVDSYKVYEDAPGLNDAAALRGFSAATAEGAWVIVAEMQSPTSFTGAIATAAENAFVAGAAVVGANGNNTFTSVVAAPANAHRVLGIGGEYACCGNGTIAEQVSGPTTDSRIKPDIQTPSYADTASRNGSSALGTHSGTSGATAFAGAAAGVFSRWWCDSPSKCVGVPDPNDGPIPYAGPTYAALIAHGSKTYPFPSTQGAGPLRMMQSYGYDWYGWITIGNGQTIDVPYDITVRSGYTPNDIMVGIWWPETPAQSHSRVYLRLINPSNVAVASSTDLNSVFQRVAIPGSVAYGTWKLRFVGSSIPSGSQKVFYWARTRGGA